MSEERTQEIKDSINFQYELIVSKGIDKSALLFTDEEQELLEEVERLNNIINELEKYIRSYINLLVENPDMIEQGQLDILYEVLDKIKELKEGKRSEK